MTKVDADEPLTENTARLSISMRDDDGDDIKLQIRNTLRNSGYTRRDSAVSISSLNEEESQLEEHATNSRQGDSKGEAKRRRSSTQAQSFSANKKKHVQKELKVHKKKLKKSQEVPSLELTTALNAVKKHPFSEKKLTVNNIRDLLVHIFNKERNHLSWIQIQAPDNIRKVVVCFVSGLLVEEIVGQRAVRNEKFVLMSEAKGPEVLPFFKENFKYILQTSAPGNKDSLFLPFHALTYVPLSKKEKKELIDKLKNVKLTLWDLLLTYKQMKDNNYPIHHTIAELYEEEQHETDDEGIAIRECNSNHEIDSYTLLDAPDTWVETKKFDHEGSHTFALDCEFCQANGSKVLTRISLVNFQNEVVLDSLVKPREEITDYLTKYSGITEERLKGVSTSLKDIQNKLLGIVSSDDILIGHSLDSDLNVLKLKHPRIIDTAISYEHHRGPPLKPSLKWLASTYLGRLIQDGEKTSMGHSSIEDATACMDLIKLKIQEGKYFGLNINEVPLYEKLNKDRHFHSSRKEVSFEPVRTLFIDYALKQDQSLDSSKEYVHRFQSKNDGEALDIFKRELPFSDLIILKLRELEFYKGWSAVPKHYNGQVNFENGVSENRTKNDILSSLNSRLEVIYSLIPENSAMIICTPTGNPKEMLRLQGIKRKFQAMERQGKDIKSLSKDEIWDFDKQLALQQAVEGARRTMALICLKQNHD